MNIFNYVSTYKFVLVFFLFHSFMFAANIYLLIYIVWTILQSTWDYFKVLETTTFKKRFPKLNKIISLRHPHLNFCVTPSPALWFSFRFLEEISLPLLTHFFGNFILAFSKFSICMSISISICLHIYIYFLPYIYICI